MKKLQKFLSLLMCLCMLMGAAALAEDAAQPASEPEGSTVVATVEGESITWDDVKPTYSNLVAQYGSYYDLTQQDNIELFRAVAMENAITKKMMLVKAKELGLDALTDEEIATAEQQADADWDAALDNYISYYHSDLTEESTEEEKAAAKEEAVKYYNDGGYTPESLREEYKQYAVLGKVEGVMTQDATVTDQEVEDAYQALVAADKELYENDIAAYVEYNGYVDQMAMYAAIYGMGSDMDHAWYKPAGFRAVKHILLPVDETLMNTYTDLQARYEEQQHAADAAAEEGTDEAAEETPAEPVTEAQVNEAKAAIFNSLAEKIDEINQKIAEGVDFDELIATYGVNADGSASDPGMAEEPTKTNGYEVSEASSGYYDPEFVKAAMSISEIGGVSAPYLSRFGVHIVKYIGDVPGGPVAMTDAQRAQKREELLSTKRSELYTQTMEEWLSKANITYTGVIPSIDELQAAQAEEGAAAAEQSGDAVSQDEAQDMMENSDAPAEDAPAE